MAIAQDELKSLDERAISQLEGSYEYVNGRYVEKPSMGARSNRMAFKLMKRLDDFVEANGLGHCFGENLPYKIFPSDPKKSRIPDGSFVRAGRLPGEEVPAGFMTIPPDLAIEVVSPNDEVENLFERIGDLMGAGVRLLWVIDPASRQVHVHRADGTATRLGDADSLGGEDVIPGFACPLGELFDSV
jgi:Uma2 family endonuclease